MSIITWRKIQGSSNPDNISISLFRNVKALHLLINTNLVIAAAAVSLAMATQVQLGLPPMLNAGLLLLFLATLADYNLHRLLAVYNKAPETQPDKFTWAAGHKSLLKTLVAGALAGLVICAFFVKTNVFIALVPLAMLSFFYSLATRYNLKGTTWLLRVPGTRTFILALVWAAATVLIPAIQANIHFKPGLLWLVFAQRFTFIVAIAIPFDMRDMEADAGAGIRSIPATIGAKKALLFCNAAVMLSAIPALFQYLCFGVIFIFPATLVSMFMILFFVNSSKIRRLPFYYHGILDGSIILYALIIILGFYLIN